MSSILDDLQVIRDFGLAVVLVYVGCDLVSIDHSGRKPEFVILVPKFDLEEYRREYEEGRLQVADAKAICQTHSSLGRLCADTKRQGGVYVNPDFREMLRDEAAR